LPHNKFILSYLITDMFSHTLQIADTTEIFGIICSKPITLRLLFNNYM